MIESIFFDMDGTLVDTEPYWLEAETQLMSLFGYTWLSSDQKNCLGGPLPRVGEYMYNIAKSESPEFFVDELIKRVHGKFLQGINFMPGARSFLEELKNAGIPLGLVSASPRILVDATLSLLSRDTFSVSVSSDDVTKSKPDPEPYLLAASALGTDITKSVILEDSKTGIASAQSAGAVVLALPHIVKVEPHARTEVLSTLVDFDLNSLQEIFSRRVVK